MSFTASINAGGASTIAALVLGSYLLDIFCGCALVAVAVFDVKAEHARRTVSWIPFILPP